MSKYTEEFRREAIELMKKIGITKAAKELDCSPSNRQRNKSPVIE